jgi:hypothetical protein
MFNEKYEYSNLIALARSVGFKKIMVMRNSWSNGNWGVVNKIYIKDDTNETYCKNVTGHIHYKNGNTSNGSFSCFNTYAWRIIKVFDDQNIEIILPKKKKSEDL